MLEITSSGTCGGEYKGLSKDTIYQFLLMKILLLALLFLAVLGEERHFFVYKDGELVVGGEPAVKTDGPMYINFLNTMNITLIAGMHVKGTVMTPFGFQTRITKFTRDGENIKVEARCSEMAWGQTYFRKLSGTVVIEGTYQKASYVGACTNDDTKIEYKMKASGVYSACRVLFSQPESAKRAQTLVGAKAELYKAVHVLDYAYMGYPYLGPVADCKYYNENFKDAAKSGPGLAIVGKDNAHCAIIDAEGDKFIHSNPGKKEVTLTPLSMINDYFKKGYVFKDVKC